MAKRTNMKTLGMNSQEILLGVLFIIYFVLGYPIPSDLADVIDTPAGKLVVVFVVALLFLFVNPIIAVVGVLVAVDLVRRSEQSTGRYAMKNYMPSEKQKTSNMNKFNQFPYTLEQEMVSIRTLKQQPINTPSSYKPVLENDHNASPIASIMQ